MQGCARSSRPTRFRKESANWGGKISDDYRGQTVVALGILENSFLFMADLVRAVDVPVVCAFIKPTYKQSKQGESPLLEIFSATNWPLQASMCCWSRAWCTQE
jgi:hypoxanthine-guanine phosphoribosyltransferase